MSNDRIEKLAQKLEAATSPEQVAKIISKAKIPDLMVLEWLNMGSSGPGKHPITEAIAEELNRHFSESENYLSR